MKGKTSLYLVKKNEGMVTLSLIATCRQSPRDCLVERKCHNTVNLIPAG